MYTVNLNLIRKKREEMNISKAEMARRIGLSYTEKYSRRESGMYEFQANEIPLLSDILDIPYKKIFKEINAKIAK